MTAGLDTFMIAAAGGAGGGLGPMLIQFAPFLIIIVIFYFLLIRPQQQRAKKHREMIENLRRGDEVVISGGMIGKVTRLTDNEATVEIAENVRVKVIRQTIAEVRARTEPAKGPKMVDDPHGDDEKS